MALSKALEALLERVFDDMWEEQRESLGPAEYEERRHDFVFHMTDWTKDCEELAALHQHPEGYDPERASRFVIGFLYHVIPHLNAAGRLLLESIPDPFAAAVKEARRSSGTEESQASRSAVI